jgi:hypothetical protein
MPENDAPMTLAEKFAESIRTNDSVARDELIDQIPSIRYPRGKGAELVEKIAEFGTNYGRSLEKEWYVKTDAERWLFSYAVQDAAAVHCGMPEDQQVTCVEHRTWRTADHLTKHHTGATSTEPSSPAIEPDPAWRVRVLTGHVSPETAYVVDDYPYGRVLRCKIRYWIETATKGAKKDQQRFVSQTTNPKKAGEPWNKPHPGTYASLQVLYLDEVDHVQHWDAGLYFDPVDHARARLMDLPAQLTEGDRRVYDFMLEASRRYPGPWDEFDRAVTALADYIREHGRDPETPNSVFESAAGRWYLRAPGVYLSVARQRVATSTS